MISQKTELIPKKKNRTPKKRTNYLGGDEEKQNPSDKNNANT